jgi:hypothetical protein
MVIFLDLKHQKKTQVDNMMIFKVNFILKTALTVSNVLLLALLYFNFYKHLGIIYLIYTLMYAWNSRIW